MSPRRITWRYLAVAALVAVTVPTVGQRLDAETRAQERHQESQYTTTTTTVIDIGTPATLWRVPETR